MNPLMVVRGARKGVDARLIDQKPMARADLPALRRDYVLPRNKGEHFQRSLLFNDPVPA
jgi:hypothetical protein